MCVLTAYLQPQSDQQQQQQQQQQQKRRLSN